MDAFNSIGHDYSGLSFLIFAGFIAFAVYHMFIKDKS